MARELPRIKIEGETYFIDKRLKEIRNINNSSDYEIILEEVIEYWLKHNITSLDLEPSCY